MEEVKELAQVQREILTNAGRSVKPGGRLIYSVCTLTRLETVGLVAAFGETHPEFEPLALPAVSADEKSQNILESATAVTLWPQQSGGGGMFIAAWRRPIRATV